MYQIGDDAVKIKKVQKISGFDLALRDSTPKIE
jgi:hypothetical protein